MDSGGGRSEVDSGADGAGATGLALALVLAGMLPLLVRTAWLCDEALLTLRTANHLLDGDGLRWNAAERVQTYAHPLWLFLLCAVMGWSEEHFFTPMIVSMSVSLLAAVVLARRVAQGTGAALLGLALLAGSKVFVDFSSSGMENPLTHLLLAACLAGFYRDVETRGRGRGFVFYGGLLLLNRLDLAFLVVPALLTWTFGSPPRTTARRLVIGLLPALAWEAFAFVYYGFPLPNAAYVTLNAGLSAAQLSSQGLRYLQSSILLDPLAPAAILAALLLASLRRDRCGLAVAAGAVLYVGYAVCTGGDSLAGRFLSAPYFASVAVLVRLARGATVQAAATACVLAVSLASPLSPLRLDPDYGVEKSATEPPACQVDAWGVGDGRCLSFRRASLMHSVPRQQLPAYHSRPVDVQASGPIVLVHEPGKVGFYGLLAERGRHVIDVYGLTDPLLARLPAAQLIPLPPDHLRRPVPAGYLETLAGAPAAAIADPIAARCQQNLRTITRGDIWSGERWGAIWRHALGRSGCSFRR